MKTLRSSAAGFSLLEVMIAGGIMAFFAMVLLQVNELQTRMVTTNQAQMETFTLLFQVQQVLADPVSCSISVGQAFGKVTDLRDLNGKSAVKLPVLYRAYKNVLGKYEAVKFLTPGQMLSEGSLRVNDIRLEPHAEFDGQLDVVLTIERLRKGVFGGAVVQKRVPINVDIIGMEHANAFDGIMCLNPAQQISNPDTTRRLESAILSAMSSSSGDEGFAADSTKKELAKACLLAGGVWNTQENHCQSTMPVGDTSALRASCQASGGRWDDSGRHCNVAAH
ncbi:MAG: hypothetical protein JST04_18325 [Bdellovibrionales bacterium]|nr:hypothetical protein [Bdellovibrionales bacterium]